MENRLERTAFVLLMKLKMMKIILNVHEPFFSDIKKSIKTKIVILLDHSSSISSDAIEYKKATIALCEVLSFLKIKFAVYAFSTENRSVVCI